MRRWIALACTSCLMLAVRTGWAQAPPPKPADTASLVQDPYGRQTPRETMLGFLGAAQRGRYGVASQYLQLSPRDPPAKRKLLASQLRDLLDRGFTRAGEISNHPEGSRSDDLPPNNEKVGVIQTPAGEVDVLLTRIVDKETGPIWLFSAATVARIPNLYREVGLTTFEEVLPDFLVEKQFLGAALWKWSLVLFLIPALLAGIWLVLRIIRLILQLVRHDPGPRLTRVTFGPIGWILVISVHWAVMQRIGLPLLFRYNYARILGVAAVGTLLWLAMRAVDIVVNSAGKKTSIRDRAFVASMSGLVGQVSKGLLMIVAFLLVLALLGFDVKTALAGVGIGGIAIALGAQKTLENLIGGVSFLTDRVLNVGDTCRVGTQSGRVESISLRSTKIRTDDGSLLAVPNGVMASINVENLSNRTRFLFNPIISVRYETQAKQLLGLLDRIRAILQAHPRIDPKGLWVRFKNFGASSLEIEASAHVQTADYSEYLGIREQLLVEIMNAVEAVGTGLSLPSQRLYLARDASLTAADLRTKPEETAASS